MSLPKPTRSLFDVVRQYRESYDVYGTKMSFEWEQLQDESHVIFDGGENASRIDVPDTDPMLIEEIAHFTKREKIDDPNHVSFKGGRTWWLSSTFGAGVCSCHH